MACKHWLVGSLTLGCALASSSALAQEATAQVTSEPASAEPVAAPEATTEAQTVPEAEDSEKTDPMGWFGIGLKIGVAGIAESSEFEIDDPTQPDGKSKIKAESRTGFQLAVPINLGGDGFGWILEPYLNFDSDVTAGGLYTGPTINIHVMDPLYVGVGIGLKAAYWVGAPKNVDVGLDIGARLPITATYYVMDDIAGVVELGLGYGASGSAGKPQVVTDANGQLVKTDPSVTFGSAFAWDLTVGVRWP